MKRALLIGINKYPTAPLRGCVNDVNDMVDYLVNQKGLAISDIELLIDENATTSQILDSLNRLVSDVQPGDSIYFHYSGHGAQMPTLNQSGEVDGLDEVICPVDFDWSNSHVVRDKDFNRIFARVVEGCDFNWVSDSCHSGDLSRDIPPDGILWRTFPNQPILIQQQLEIAKQLMFQPLSFRGIEVPGNYALISACKSDQTAADARFNDKPNGALTYYLKSTLLEQGGDSLPLNNLVSKIAQKIKDSHYKQEPGVEGNPDIIRKPFLAG